MVALYGHFKPWWRLENLYVFTFCRNQGGATQYWYMNKLGHAQIHCIYLRKCLTDDPYIEETVTNYGIKSTKLVYKYLSSFDLQMKY